MDGLKILGVAVFLKEFKKLARSSEVDIDRPGVIWEFGKNIEGKEVYIKLKIAEIAGKKYAKCISFHRAKFPMCYPLKK